MDGQRRTSSNVGVAAIEDAVGSLRKALQAILTVQGVPTLDVEWLLLRCDDTLAYSGDVRWSSLQVLIRDAEDFDEEFSGLLAPSVLAAVQALRQ